ncbi:type II toxin-antitoxin system RelE/ParE family toxin [Jannaschia sp. CCS1]|uniref:type II toxin-antitoxin system RelE/ParE family toxin n=1 Tax=Jannaschia sp. (strain CCS1) TaxID=290400 RepID=UPI00006BFF5E|nr:type II toxin-antitoxin system RelE/ParE family toxin [Jannaschia sp. CCS1]ABD52941.1 plasmid stabilization system [Jannaschia sp. CCS1]
MKELVIAPRADADLIGIYDYTSDTWGLDQADKYLDELHGRISGLVTGATVSRSAEEVGPGLRRALAGQHVVFFREDAETVKVVRVLHQRMDLGR